jgi:hypothetical protein
MSLFFPGVVFNRWYWSDNSLKSTSDSTSQRYDKKVVKNLDLTLSAGAGKINISSLPNNSSNLFIENNSNMGPIAKDVVSTNDTVAVNLYKQKMSYFLLNPEQWGKRSLSAKINPNINLNLMIKSGASAYDYNFTKLKLDNFELDTGASSGTINFGSLTDIITAKITLGASNLTINIPAKTAIKITTNSGLTKINLGSIPGLVRTNNIITSSDYKTSKDRIIISLVAGASNIKVEKN